MQSIDMGKARIIEAARRGSTISGVARETGIPFATVRRSVYAFQSMGVIRTVKMGKKVFIRVNQNHPLIDPMVRTARWINSIIWDPDTFLARVFERSNIDYAFVGTSKIKYTRKEFRNMVQVAVPADQHEKARRIVKEAFDAVGVRTTEDPSKTIGNAMSIVYVKCFPVTNSIRYKVHAAKTADSHEAIQLRIADRETEHRAMQRASAKDTILIPAYADTSQ